MTSMFLRPQVHSGRRVQRHLTKLSRALSVPRISSKIARSLCLHLCTFIEKDVFLSFIGTNNIAFDLKEKGKFTPTYILRCGLPIQQSRPDTDPGRNHLVQILKVIQRPPIPNRLSACNSLSKVCKFDVQHHLENIIFGDEEGKLSSLLAVRVWDSY